jgi:hypothetical protein
MTAIRSKHSIAAETGDPPPPGIVTDEEKQRHE